LQITSNREEKPGTHLYGDNRYPNAIEIYKDIYPETKSADAVIIARADDFADALSGAVLAYTEKGPLLITGSDELHEEIAEEIERVLKDSSIIYTLGGTAAISETVKNALINLGDYSVKRIAGENRMKTAYEIARPVEADSEEVIIAYSCDFPDAIITPRVNGYQIII